ncbi:MAG: hypothetical protein AAF430_08125 [Myxococcota bacterium]
MRVAAGVLLAGIFFAALVWTTLGQTAVTCEVCLTFAGREACRESSGADREQARAMAQSTACAVLSSGVTQGLQCQRVVPSRTRCDGDS